MAPSYYILLFTTLVIPFLAIIINRKFKPEVLIKHLKIPLILTVFYLLSQFSGFSIAGDYPDLLLNSLAYLLFVISVLSFPKMLKQPIHTKITRSVLLIPIALTFIAGLFGIFFFILISQDLESKAEYSFSKNSKQYTTRKYQSGFVTQLHIKYTFDTYQTIIPNLIERKIDKTVFRDTNSKLDLYNPDSLTIVLENKKLIFSSANGVKYTKEIN